MWKYCCLLMGGFILGNIFNIENKYLLLIIPSLLFLYYKFDKKNMHIGYKLNPECKNCECPCGINCACGDKCMCGPTHMCLKKQNKCCSK